MTTPKQYVVGGAPRDILLGKPPSDLDFVWTGATPDFMLQNKMTQVGSKFPVFLDNEGNEHALARTESKVERGYYGFECLYDPSITIEQDLFRRDLTINALAVPFDLWDKFITTRDTALVIDPFGGKKDLERGLLRHVSEHFKEDCIRVLRVARFAARYEFDVPLSTVSLMKDLVDAGELDTLVPERVWSETERALTEKNPAAFFRTLKLCGALEKIFPELKIDGFFETCLSVQNSKYCLSEVTIDADPTTIFALMCLKLSPTQITELCERLKAPNDFKQIAIRSVNFINMLRWNEFTPESVVSALESINVFQDLLTLEHVTEIAAFSAYNTQKFRKRLQQIYDIALQIYDIRFANLTTEQQQTLKGPEIGAALKNLRIQKVEELL